MDPKREPRKYNSPLRDAQASETRQHILETMAEMLATGGGDQFSVKLLAGQADVSERTVYRYFPDRPQLLAGLAELMADAMGNRQQEADLATLEDLTELLGDVYQGFDDHSEVTKAFFLLNPDPGARTDQQLARTERMVHLAGATFPDLAPEDHERLGQLIRSMTSTYSWLQCREEFGLTGTEAADLLGWAVTCVINEVQRTGRVGREAAPSEA